MLNSSEHTRCAQHRGAYVGTFCCCSNLNFLLLSFCFTWMVFSFQFVASCDFLRIQRPVYLYLLIHPYFQFEIKAQSTFIVHIRIGMLYVYKVFPNSKMKFSHKWVTKHRELWTMRKAMDQIESQSWIMYFKMIHKNLIVEICEIK